MEIKGIRKITGFVEDGVVKVHVYLRGNQAEVLKVLRLLPDLPNVLGIGQYDPIARQQKSPLDQSEL
ncbi:hypothetical protein MK805_15200 [Shimazuella sp. AN120528]|uniref:hypothetical protein n=1 Tax=Shimazuella soli TaxID=1892854 RepID=UPI001F102415|nr:hypothetical protein [Shimazuella soli]MCH5586288.1 hypothetical protein [Shimazuella soli]